MASEVRSVPERLRSAAELFEKRNAAYGGNYLLFGRVLHEMFPDGLTVDTADAWRRVALVVHLATKMTRYACNAARGQGHADSLEDMSVYAQMLAECDELVDKPEGGMTLQEARDGRDATHAMRHVSWPTNARILKNGVAVWYDVCGRPATSKYTDAELDYFVGYQPEKGWSLIEVHPDDGTEAGTVIFSPVLHRIHTTDLRDATSAVENGSIQRWRENVPVPGMAPIFLWHRHGSADDTFAYRRASWNDRFGLVSWGSIDLTVSADDWEIWAPRTSEWGG